MKFTRRHFFRFLLPSALIGFSVSPKVLSNEKNKKTDKQDDSLSAGFINGDDSYAKNERKSRTDSVLRIELADPEGAEKYPDIQLSRWRDNIDVRGWGAIADSNELCDKFFIEAEKIGGPIYIPPGNWRLSSPMILGVISRYYGPGTLIFDKAEWWRRGGSSGGDQIPEKYTLFFNYSSKSDVRLLFDDKEVPFTWVDEKTIQGPGSKPSVSVKIIILNGSLPLGPTAESIKSFNTFGNACSGSRVSPHLTKSTDSAIGFDNTSFGSRSLSDIESGVNNTAVGSKSLLSNRTGNNNTGVGFQALYRSTSDFNTSVGSISGEWLTSGGYNCLYGANSGKKLTAGSFNVAIGFDALGESPETNYTVAVGYRANANTGQSSQTNSVYIGAFAGDYNIGSNNTFVGYRAGNCIDAAKKTTLATGMNNVGLGMFAMRRNLKGSESVAIGAGAGAAAMNVNASVVIGFAAAAASPALGDYSIAIGHSSSLNSAGAHNVGIGYQSLLNNKDGSGNVAIGNLSLQNNTIGKNNTAIGHNSGVTTFSGSKAERHDNTVTIGYDARISDSNQIQLGNSQSTTYVYGTVQNRSDLRDKTDIRDTELGIDFILGLRAVDGRWDLRDDYIERIDTVKADEVIRDNSDLDSLQLSERRCASEFVQHKPDGTHKRTRYHHWFIAQEVQELCKTIGVEFGGLQHHQINGGDDVYSLGYDEFIPPVVRAIQDCWKRIDEIDSRLKKLESI